MDEPLSETVSNKTGGKGRPPAFSEEGMAFMKAMHVEVHTRRSLLNRAYETLALGLCKRFIQQYPVLEALNGCLTDMSNPKRLHEPLILTELGRALRQNGWPDETVLQWAIEAVSLRSAGMTAHSVARAVRMARRG